MKPIEIYNIIRYRRRHPNMPKEVPFSIAVNKLYERVMLETAQKARFIPISDTSVASTEERLGNSLDQYAITNDERLLFSELLNDAVWRLAEKLQAYLVDDNGGISIDDAVIVFKTKQPAAIWKPSTILLINQSLYRAALYYILREWYIKANIAEAEIWNSKLEEELGRLRGYINRRAVDIGIQPWTLG